MNLVFVGLKKNISTVAELYKNLNNKYIENIEIDNNINTIYLFWVIIVFNSLNKLFFIIKVSFSAA